jgi:hypothetical protein
MFRSVAWLRRPCEYSDPGPISSDSDRQPMTRHPEAKEQIIAWLMRVRLRLVRTHIGHSQRATLGHKEAAAEPFGRALTGATGQWRTRRWVALTAVVQLQKRSTSGGEWDSRATGQLRSTHGKTMGEAPRVSDASIGLGVDIKWAVHTVVCEDTGCGGWLDL